MTLINHSFGTPSTIYNLISTPNEMADYLAHPELAQNRH